jgi:glucose/arabinose dehydrogenase
MTLLADRPAPVAPPPVHETRKRSPRWRLWLALLIVLLILGGALAWFARGKGYVYKVRTWINPPKNVLPPVVGITKPSDGATGVPLDAVISADIRRARGLLDAKSARANVLLIRTADQSVVPAKVEVFGMTRVTLKPTSALEPGTNYTFVISEGFKDNQGGRVIPLAAGFITAAPEDPVIKFQRVLLPSTKGITFSCLQVRGRTLYAQADDGRLFLYPIAEDGRLGKPQIITSLQEANKGPRLAIGFAFDPASTDEAPILWVTHGILNFSSPPDFSCKVSRLSGKNFEVVEDTVINLPRSVRDHTINQPSFGPDGALYWPQPSNTAMGAPDDEWLHRPERKLCATILRLDTKRVTPGKPIDAKTPEAGGTFDPAAPGSPLTIYAYGVRLAYDLLWADDGNLYAPVNGSAAGGNTPLTGAADDQPLKDVPISEDDWLFRIKPGRYYGHPNPFHGTHILNGANPTKDYDFAEVPHYKVGTQPDPNWERAVFVFGKHTSANGVIQYKSNTFGGKLRGKMIVCRYQMPGDLAVLSIDGSNITELKMSIPAFSGMLNPLDLAEDPTNGNLYVTEYGAQRLILLRPVEK